MLLKIIIIYIFLIKVFNCNVIYDRDFIAKSKLERENVLFYIDTRQCLKSVVYSFAHFDYYDVVSYIPLENPSILGSFSNESMFIIGSKYLNGIKSTHDKHFNPIYIVSEPKTYQHSIYINDNDVISLIAITYNNSNQDYAYYSTVIYTIDFKNDMKDNVIYLKHCSRSYNVHQIKINIDYIKSFGGSIDKSNRIYSTIIKEYDTNKTLIVKFNYDELQYKSYHLNETMLSFNNGKIYLGVYNEHVMVVDSSNSNSIHFNLYNNNETIIDHRNFEPFNKIITENPNNFITRASNGIYYCSIYNQKYSECYSSLDYPLKINIDNGFGDWYYTYRLPYYVKEIDVADLVIKLVIPVSTILIIVFILVLLYFFVYKKRKQRRDILSNNQINDHSYNKQDKSNETNKDEIEIESHNVGADLDIDNK